jgi:hypothetical protein
MENKQYTLQVQDGNPEIYHSEESFIAAVKSFSPDGNVRNVSEAIEFVKQQSNLTVDIKQVGLEVKLTLKGFTLGDIELALNEAKRLLMAGNELGSDQNESGSYDFDVEGEELEVLDELSQDDLIEIVEPSLPVTEETIINHFPEGYANGDQYYLIKVQPEGDELYFEIFDAHEFYANGNGAYIDAIQYEQFEVSPSNTPR